MGPVAPASRGDYHLIAKCYGHYTKFKTVYLILAKNKALTTVVELFKIASCLSNVASYACEPMAVINSLPTTTVTTARVLQSSSSSTRPTLHSEMTSLNEMSARNCDDEVS